MNGNYKFEIMEQKMIIDIRDTDMIIDGKVIDLPSSCNSLRDILGEARVVPKSEKKDALCKESGIKINYV